MSTIAAPVARSGRKTRKARRQLPTLTAEQLAAVLVAHHPFYELFAEVDAVFDEDDAMTPEKRQMGMGRLYRAWKKAREELDPDYEPRRDRRGT